MSIMLPAENRPDVPPAHDPWQPYAGCTPECVVPVPCSSCGRDLPPRGRAVPLYAYLSSCCDEQRFALTNTRHLWSDDELPGEPA